jgi:hypothetical protein
MNPDFVIGFVCGVILALAVAWWVGATLRMHVKSANQLIEAQKLWIADLQKSQVK